MNDKNEKLYVPANISIRRDIWQGFGFKELIITLIVSTITLIILGFVAAAGLIASTTFVAIQFGVMALTTMMLQKVDNNLSIVDYVIIMIEFGKKQQIYLFKERELDVEQK